METLSCTRDVILEPTDNRRLADLCGQFDQHIKQVEKHLKVEIHNRGNVFNIRGDYKAVNGAALVLLDLYEQTEEITTLTPDIVHSFLQKSHVESISTEKETKKTTPVIKTRQLVIKPRGLNQQQYVEQIRKCDVSFGIGPAGTGKTYLAVACAVSALEAGEVERLIITRPAVEAGERLGFLPGDLSQKVDPYLRPIYDALYEMKGIDVVNKLIEKSIIEVAPLAFMRGRTLNNAFIILDESQNTTVEQMKMFLTRIGFGSKAVVTGDITQTDLPKQQQSGLCHVIDVLKNIDSVHFTFFKSKDVVRNQIVQQIVEAYEEHAS